MRDIGSIAVFCGSNVGATDDYARGAGELGTALARAGIALVYGGTTKGLMGLVADAALAGGGAVHGVITQGLHDRGHSHGGLTSHEITASLHLRKARMVERADAFIALPGGIGTLEEFMVVWSMNQLGEIDKPAGLLDIAGFYAPFRAFIDHMVDTRFLPAAHRQSIVADADPAALIGKLRAYERVEAPKWL